MCSQVLYKLHKHERLLDEWLWYHRGLGADHFVLYDRDNSLPRRILEKYEALGFLTYYPDFNKHLSDRHHAVHSETSYPSHA